MKHFKLIVIAAAMIAAPALAADVGVSISIGQPGFYGQLDIGNYSRPPVIYSRPVVIQRIPRGEIREPLYLRVPAGQARNWRRYCSRYNACGRPVYFVRNDWYTGTYAPRYREEHRDDRRDDRDDYNDRNNDNDRRDRRDDNRNDDRERGNRR